MLKHKAAQLKKSEDELKKYGVLIEGVHGTEKYSSLLACLVKAAVIFIICCGMVVGFSDAFRLEYNKAAVVGFTLLISVLISLLYYSKKTFYFGYAAVFILFALELMRYYIYANSGFQAIMNTVRESYAEHFGMTYVKTAEELLENRYVTITVALIFLVFFVVILLNITVSRYMNLAETFCIAFIVLELPLYIGYKPPLLSIMMVMAGCICVGIMQRGANMRMVVPSKGASEFVYNRLFKKNYFTTRGSSKGMLKILAFSAVLSLVVCIGSIGVYERRAGKTEPDSAKAAIDDRVKIFVQNGIWGFFDRYNSVNGLFRGALGGVSSVRPDFETDIIVTYTPSSTDTVYLSGYKGSTYSGSNWLNYVAEDGMGFARFIYSEIIDGMDEEYYAASDRFGNNSAKMQVSYLDVSANSFLIPYISLGSSNRNIANPAFKGQNEQLDRKLKLIRKNMQLEYTPYFSDVMLEKACNPEYDLSESDEYYSGEYRDYVVNSCTAVPGKIVHGIDEFIYEHHDFGLSFSRDVNGNIYEPGYTPQEKNEYRIKAVEAISTLFDEEFTYTLAPGKTPSQEDFVLYFLTEQKRGYCSHFASAAVILLRSLKIPARYVEGYCIPYSYLLKNGQVIETDGSEWFGGTPEANLEKKTYSVEVSDYYAHAWIEVYLEGIGFVPFEVTPASNEDVPEVSAGSGIRNFFAQLMNVDLGLGRIVDEDIVISKDDVATEAAAAAPAQSLLFGPLLVIVLLAVLAWAVVLLVRYVRQRLLINRLLSEERFDRLVFIAYNELVKWLNKKGITDLKNPLPMELSGILSEYWTEAGKMADGNTDEIFRYVERAIYSDAGSTSEEYERFLKDLDTLKRGLKNMKR